MFVAPGVVKAADGNTALDRFNRSFEYDGLGDNYARFLLEELLPEVETKKTSDGRVIKLSHEGNDRSIGGASSGAIAAFTAAWERPDAFSRVFSSIGTYVDLRGGMRYPSLIRKYEPKPIRIFLQDGSNDLNIYGGDWWMVNQTMERSLAFAGYEVQHSWGDGGHTAIGHPVFPDDALAVKDGPSLVAGKSKNATPRHLIPGEGWQLVARISIPEGPAANARVIFFTDIETVLQDWPRQQGERVHWNTKRGSSRAFGGWSSLRSRQRRSEVVSPMLPMAQQSGEGFAGNDRGGPQWQRLRDQSAGQT